jgi:hypothetical protein
MRTSLGGPIIWMQSKFRSKRIKIEFQLKHEIAFADSLDATNILAYFN